MSKKLDNVRVVTFKEDYKPQGVVIYGKDTPHYIHISVVELLKGNGVKMDVKEFDEKKVTAEAVEAFNKAKKEEAKEN